MQETFEFRIPETYAKEYLKPNEGKTIAGIARQLTVSRDDDRFLDIGRIDHDFRKKGKAFFTGWVVHRKYSQKELDSAELLQLKIPAVFEPTGEECGTVYDYTEACAHCGKGRRQMSALRLDTARIPKSKDIAKTIGEEIVISKRMRSLFKKHAISGAELGQVEHAGRSVRTGTDAWYQLVITSKEVPVAEETRFGEIPFDEASPEAACPSGHSKGLNLLSELSVLRNAWDGSDVNCTTEMVGSRSGLLVAAPLMLISQRLWRLMKAEKLKGVEVEVVSFAE